DARMETRTRCPAEPVPTCPSESPLPRIAEEGDCFGALRDARHSVVGTHFLRSFPRKVWLRASHILRSPPRKVWLRASNILRSPPRKVWLRASNILRSPPR